jgi:hypothetical protein
MDFASFLQVIARRWKLVAIGLVVTVALAFAAATTLKPTYEAGASVLLYSPDRSEAAPSGSTAPTTAAPRFDQPDESQNPLAGTDLGVVTDVMAQRMADPAVVERLLRRDSGGTWEVAQNTETRTPLLVVSASAPTNGEAIGTMKNVLAEINHQLEVVQKGDPLITTQIVRRDTVAAAKSGSRVRTLAAVLLLGIIASFSLPFVADGLQEAKRRRREGKTKLPESVGLAPAPRAPDITHAEAPDTPDIRPFRRPSNDG